MPSCDEYKLESKDKSLSKYLSYPVCASSKPLPSKFTLVLATLFIVTSIALVEISRDELRETQSVLEKEEEKNSNLPQIPESSK